MCQISSQSVYSVTLGRRKTQNFARRRHTEKVELGCTTTNLPVTLSNGIKIVYIFQQLHGKIAHKLLFKSMTSTQIKKTLTFLVALLADKI